MTTPTDKVDLARRIVRLERGLKKLPAATHAAVVETAKLPVKDLRARLKGAEVALAGPRGRVTFTPGAEIESRAADAGSIIISPSDAPKWDACPGETPPVTHADLKRPSPTPITKRQPHGRVIRIIPLGNGRQRVLHATRGWREERV